MPPGLGHGWARGCPPGQGRDCRTKIPRPQIEAELLLHNACNLTRPCSCSACSSFCCRTPEQALAVAECLHAMRQAQWAAYGPQIQQAWREQLMPDQAPPEFDPDEPF